MSTTRSATTTLFMSLCPVRPAACLLAGVFAAALAAAAPAQVRTDGGSNGGSFEIAQSDYLRQDVEALRNRVGSLERQLEQLASAQARLLAELQELRQAAAATGTAYRSLAGKVDRDERHLGPATFVLPGDRLGRPTDLKLDRALVLEMCGDAEGCLLQLGLEGIVIGGEEVETRFSRGPCSFHLDRETGAWALSGLCAATDLPPLAADAAADPGAPAWGRLGDASPIGGAEQDGRVILGFGGACYLAEAAPERRQVTQQPARLQRDTGRDLYLVAAGAKWDPAQGFPFAYLPLGLTDPLFRCRLTLRD